MKGSYLCIFILIGVLVVLSIVGDKWLFETVMATDWPDWVKYLLLRG